MPAAFYAGASRQRHELFQKLSLKEGETELRILMALSKSIGWANVYQLWKGLRDVGHYSTVLRALRRLEQKRLVETLASRTGRNEKIYTPTLLGELIAALARGEWKAAAQILAERSSRFRECVKAHRALNPLYYYGLTRDIIEKLLMFPKYRNIQPDLEKIVMECESWNIEEKVVQEVNDPSARPELFQYLKKLSYVDWIRSIVMSFIDEYIEEEKEWLQALADFKTEMVCAEKNAKLPQFFVDRKE